MQDTAQFILEYLPVESLVTLTNTTTASLTSKADDVWTPSLLEWVIPLFHVRKASTFRLCMLETNMNKY